MNRLGTATACAVLALSAATSSAATLAGRLDDPGNAALAGSDLGAPDFTDEFAIADNVALYGFTVGTSGLVSIVSTGFAAGGVDPYFTLFAGSGVGATFLDSNFAQAFSSGGDFSYSAVLDAGDYEIALGTFANLSFAENLGSGTLADGFIGLGEAGSLGDASYRLVLSTPVPEPAAGLLFALGLMGLTLRAHRQLATKVDAGLRHFV
jgi:hypothetical protein